jgi:hypothetical protein
LCGSAQRAWRWRTSARTAHSCAARREKAITTRRRSCGVGRAIDGVFCKGQSQGNKQKNKQANKQANELRNSVEPNRGSGAAAASRFARATRSRHDAACALRVPIGDAAAYLEEMQQLDVRGVRVRLRHARQQRLLGSVAIDRDLRELQADTALQRLMRCSCCSQYAPWQLWPMHCERRRLCALPLHGPRPYPQERLHVHVARVRACIR